MRRAKRKPPQLLALPGKARVERQFSLGAEEQALEGSISDEPLVSLAVCELEHAEGPGGRRYRLLSIFWLCDGRSQTLQGDLPDSCTVEDCCGIAYSHGRLAQRLSERIAVKKLMSG